MNASLMPILAGKWHEHGQLGAVLSLNNLRALRASEILHDLSIYVNPNEMRLSARTVPVNPPR
jgi:hypothetical protein